MKPVATVNTTTVYKLQGGTDENDLPAERNVDVNDNAVVSSVWEFSDEERAQVAAGFNVKLTVWGGQPPVAMSLTDEELR